MLFRGFWDEIEEPIIGLAPMDGVTDAAFRYLVCKYSKPSLVITEFTNVEGLARGAVQMLTAFLYDESERPVLAQIYGVEVESYYKTGVMLAWLGFDGIDINMGCPANKVAKRGSGAGLIRTPELAKKLIRITKKAVKDWSEGISLEEAGVNPNIIAVVKKIKPKGAERKLLPVSVKTRIGFDENVAEEWTKHLLEELPANITMHGRTLRQMYLGQADWDAIAKAAEVVKGSGVGFLGNGDVKSMEQAEERIKEYGVDGVLVGRATFGNPWFFTGKVPELAERLKVMVEHCRCLENYVYPAEELKAIPFMVMRKHMGWYCKGFDGAKELRIKLMQTDSADEVESIVEEFMKSNLTNEASMM